MRHLGADCSVTTAGERGSIWSTKPRGLRAQGTAGRIGRMPENARARPTSGRRVPTCGPYPRTRQAYRARWRCASNQAGPSRHWESQRMNSPTAPALLRSLTPMVRRTTFASPAERTRKPTRPQSCQRSLVRPPVHGHGGRLWPERSCAQAGVTGWSRSASPVASCPGKLSRHPRATD